MRSIFLPIFATLLLLGCDSQRDADHQQLVTLRTELQMTQQRANDLEAEVETLKSTVEELETRVQEAEDNDDNVSQKDFDKLSEKVDKIERLLGTM